MPEIPVGATVELRNSNDSWRVISYFDDEMPRFVRQYNIMSLNTGEMKRVFKNEIFEKNTSTYEEITRFFREQTISVQCDGGENAYTDIWDEILTSDFDTSMNEVNEEDTRETMTDADRSPQHASRFKAVSAADIESLASKTTEKTTNNQTKWAIKLFKEWLYDTEPSNTSFETMEPCQLDNILCKFYASLQTKKGKDYSKSALVGLRAGINRYLTRTPYQRQINIMKDRDFMKSNQVLNGLIKQMKRDGKDISENKGPVSHSDLKKLNECGLFNVENPKTLQNKVIFDIMSPFGRRGREGLRALTKSSFKVSTDADGHRYLAMAYNESDKTHHGVDSREKRKAPRLYETNNENCPLKSYEKYLSKLNPECEALFQKPLIKFQNEIWYAKVPVGVNYLYNFMARLSTEANLSRRYTNHCIRAMVASNLCEAGVSNQGIMSVTGHRNVQSLNSYIRPSDNERRVISSILSGNSDNQLALANPTLAVSTPESVSGLGPSYPTRHAQPGFNQFSSQSSGSTLNIFSGQISGGNITVNVFKQ